MAITSISQLKRLKTQNLNNIRKEIDKIYTPKGGQDTRFWKPDQDKSGNGFAVVRFLPAPKSCDIPFVKIYTHGFEGKGWYIENCPTTVNAPCPACEANSALWNSGSESDKDIVRKRKRRLAYIANVLVVSDPKHPENEGKVFLYKFGKKVFDKINDKLNPEFQDEHPIDPFCPWEGANFKIKIRKVDGYPNYDKSEFEDPSPIGDDAKIEEVWNQEHSLKEFDDPKQFKSYDELKARLNRVLGPVIGGVTTPEAVPAPQPQSAPAPSPQSSPAVEEEDKTPWETYESDDYLNKLIGD